MPDWYQARIDPPLSLFENAAREFAQHCDNKHD